MRKSLLFKRIKRDEGSVMMIALFALMVLFAFSVSFLSISSSSLTTAKRDVMRARALNVAEAGVHKAISYLRGTAPNGTTDGSWRTIHPSSSSENHTADEWRTEDLNSSEQFNLCVRNGTGVNAGKIVVTSVGTVTYGSATCSRTIQVVLRRELENVSVWSNVIFGGVGQAGKSINGNVVMRGSVHLLGDGEKWTDLDSDGRWDSGESYTDSNSNSQYDIGEPYSDTDGDGHRDAKEPYDDVNGNGVRDPALTVTDMASEVAGDANVGNNYNGMTAYLQSKIPAVPNSPFNGESVQSLAAKLRVKHGTVNISGSATVGEPNAAGGFPTLKETMNGCYVSDGYGGNKGSVSVNSDNGVTADYDLGDGIIKFPALTDPYTDKFGVSYASYMDYLQANATVDTGPLNLAVGTAQSISGPNGSLTMDTNGNMTITGIVYINGDINLVRNGTITYNGNGTLVSTGSIYAHCDVVPRTTFPTIDRIGFIARRRLELATGAGDAQLTLSGAFYAQEKVVSKKQSEIAGTLVGSYYEMQNVPHIYQVPALSQNLPPGMPGADPIWVVTITVDSWREL
ncbi:MAG: hypothetical protein Q7N50_00385 [Armatimonadota bacterium]|nr:hypothetical protein [Armatimonadota bacterium]